MALIRLKAPRKIWVAVVQLQCFHGNIAASELERSSPRHAPAKCCHRGCTSQMGSSNDGFSKAACVLDALEPMMALGAYAVCLGMIALTAFNGMTRRHQNPKVTVTQEQVTAVTHQVTCLSWLRVGHND